ncbi:MAG: FecR family protein [Lachnospiraceae bacterium]|nr:FecR family protein [Lachnospiraceae bacterium]
MSKRKVSVSLPMVLVMTLFAALFIGCGKKADNRKLSLIELDGVISIERGEKTLDGKLNMSLKSGDVIVTGENSNARIRIDDDKFLFLDASSRVLLSAGGTADSSETIVFVEKGAVMTEVKRKLNESSSFNVVTPNTSMAIHGTKTLTEVYEDILGALKTSAAVIEGQVLFSSIQKSKQGTPSVVSVTVGVNEGFAVTTARVDLLKTVDVKRIAEEGKTVDGQVAEKTTHEKQGSTLEKPAFSKAFLTNCASVLARSREEDIEERFVAEDVTEEELKAAINILNDVIDGKVELPTSIEDYILSQAQPYYDQPLVYDTPASGGTSDTITELDSTPYLADKFEPEVNMDGTVDDSSNNKGEKNEWEVDDEELFKGAEKPVLVWGEKEEEEYLESPNPEPNNSDDMKGEIEPEDTQEMKEENEPEKMNETDLAENTDSSSSVGTATFAMIYYKGLNKIVTKNGLSVNLHLIFCKKDIDGEYREDSKYKLPAMLGQGTTLPGIEKPGVASDIFIDVSDENGSYVGYYFSGWYKSETGAQNNNQQDLIEEVPDDALELTVYAGITEEPSHDVSENDPGSLVSGND